MKIVHLIQRPQLRGAEIAAMRSAVQLEKQGCAVIVVSLFKGDAKLDYPVRQIHLDVNFKNRFWCIRAWWKLARLIAVEKPDIIQANAGFTLKFAVFSKMIFGWRNPIVFRNASTISRYIQTASSAWFNGLFFQKADCIMSVSRNSARDFQKIFPAMASRICVVPVGIDQMDFLPNKPDRESPSILHVGGFSFEKNHTGLLRIFQQVLAHHPGAVLRLAGDGPLKSEVEQLAQQMKIGDNVKFLGACTNLSELFSQANVLVLPSIIEGLPSVLLEAFYFKVPVVVYDVGGIAEIVENGITGVSISEGDERLFAEHVSRVIAQPAEYQTMITNANKLVNTKYMNSQLVLDTIRIYRQLLASGQMNAIPQFN